MFLLIFYKFFLLPTKGGNIFEKVTIDLQKLHKQMKFAIIRIV